MDYIRDIAIDKRNHTYILALHRRAKQWEWEKVRSSIKHQIIYTHCSFFTTKNRKGKNFHSNSVLNQKGSSVYSLYLFTHFGECLLMFNIMHSRIFNIFMWKLNYFGCLPM